MQRYLTKIHDFSAKKGQKGVFYTPRVGYQHTPRVTHDDTPRVGYFDRSRVGYLELFQTDDNESFY